jgi:UDP-N-acetyl-D-mannosaminuronate dehydrogenase
VKIGMIGLGKMGADMTERLVRAGHEVVGFDLDPAAVEQPPTTKKHNDAPRNARPPGITTSTWEHRAASGDSPRATR